MSRRNVKCRFIWICIENAAVWLLRAQMFLFLVVIITALFFPQSRRTQLRHTSRSCETIRPIKRCLPAIKSVCSPQRAMNKECEKREINNFCIRVPNCFYSKSVRLKRGGESDSSERKLGGRQQAVYPSLKCLKWSSKWVLCCYLHLKMSI